jgi:UDP-glucose 4-epimerase
MKRIVVTGALGHIGSRLIRALPTEFPGCQIVLVDNLSTQRYGSLFNLPGSGSYRFIETDILESDLTEIFAEAEAVIHLAALTDAAGSADIPEELVRTNLWGTERVARACVQTGSALVFPSTTSVYGVSCSLVDETCSRDQLQPQSPYAHSKLQSEEILAELGNSQSLKYVICRFGTIFGVSHGMRFHTAINKFIWQACQQIPLTVWRTAGHQQRPYLDLTDAVRAICFILREQHFDRKIYNVLTTNATVSEIIEYIRPHVPSLRVNYVDSRIMNQLSYAVSNEKFCSLGFTFEGNLRSGILETMLLLGNLGGHNEHAHNEASQLLRGD